MNKSVLAGAALVAAVAIGSPILAWSAGDTPPQTAQAGPAGSRPGCCGPGGIRDQGPGGWGRAGGMRAAMWHARHFSPQQRCDERLARRAGFRAYVAARLQLTSDQRPLWDKLQAILQTADDKQHELCGTLKPRDQRGAETILDKMSRREQFLSARLQALQQEQPAVEALYQALTPEQKAIADHPFRRF